ncbi:MAG: protein kinase [Planctomycetia bacterium]|nr:protein kinase [Planctomycetia bacterium]
MNDGTDEREDLLAALLARYDDATADDTDRLVDESVVESDPELAEEMAIGKECLDFLARFRERSSLPGLCDSAAASNGCDVNQAPSRGELPPSIGRFRIERELGRGGLGVVYLAHDPKLARDVALKLPRVEALASADMRRRFVREAEAAARLNHPNLVTVYEAGEEGFICYLASEYCEGQNLAQWIRARGNEPVPVRQAARMALDLAEAAQHAHGRGVLHRDIKPSNVLLEPLEHAQASATSDDLTVRPKLADFGMAKLLEQSTDETRSGALVGTPAYMAPEQAEGRIHDLDARTDIYALGAVLYEMLTGSSPVKGQTDVETLRRVLCDEPTAPRRLRSDVPRDLEAICLKCLARRREDRYTTAQELAADLQRFLNGQPTEARPLRPWERAAKWARRRPAIGALVVVCAASALAMLGGSLAYNARLNRALGDTRELLYAADMRLAADAWEHANVDLVRERLDRHIPTRGGKDRRTALWHLLWDRVNSEARDLYRHEGSVYAVAVSPDGRWIATGGADRTIRLWDATANQMASKYRGHTDDINDLAFSPDGRWLASTSNDRTVCVWTIGSSDGPRVFSGFTEDWVFGVAFSPDGKRLAATGRDGGVWQWSTETWELAWRDQKHAGAVHEVAFSPDGTVLVSAGEGGIVMGRDVETWKPTLKFDPKVADRPPAVSALAFSPDGRLLATGSLADQMIRIWHAGSTDLLAKLPTSGGWVHAVAFSPDGRFLASAHHNGSIHLWDVASETVVQTLLRHRGTVRDLSFSSDGGALVTVGDDGEVTEWYITAILRRYVALPGIVRSAAFRPHGRLLAIAEDTGAVNVWDLTTGARVVHVEPGTAGPAMPLAFSPDGACLAFAKSGGREVGVWDFGRHECVAGLPLSEGCAYDVAFTSDGTGVYTATDHSTLTLWDLGPARPRASRRTEQGPIEAITLLPGRKQIVTASREGVKLWHAETLALEAALPSTDIQTVAVTLDEMLLAVAGTQGSVQVWDLTTHVLKANLTGHDDSVKSLAFSPDGTTLASASNDDTVRLWDVHTMQEVATLSLRYGTRGGHSGRAIAFSPDGGILAVAGSRFGSQGIARLWPLASGGPPASFVIDHAGSVTTTECITPERMTKHVLASHDFVVDREEKSGPSVTIGDGTYADVIGAFVVGGAHDGEMVIDGGSHVAVKGVASIGDFAPARGGLRLAGGSTLSCTREPFVIGREGQGQLFVTEGSTVRSARAILADGRESTASAIVNGESEWLLGDLLVGSWGNATLAVAEGSIVQNKSAVIGHQPGSMGSLTISGVGTKLSTLLLEVGRRGRGTTAVETGAAVITEKVWIAELRGSEGRLLVSGDGTTCECASLDVGGRSEGPGGVGVLDVQSGGVVAVDGTVRVWQEGTVRIDAGSLRAKRLDLIGSSSVYCRGGVINVAGTANLDGRLDVDPGDVDASRGPVTIRVMTYSSRNRTFAEVTAPAGYSAEPVYSDVALDVVLDRDK